MNLQQIGRNTHLDNDNYDHEIEEDYKNELTEDETHSEEYIELYNSKPKYICGDQTIKIWNEWVARVREARFGEQISEWEYINLQTENPPEYIKEEVKMEIANFQRVAEPLNNKVQWGFGDMKDTYSNNKIKKSSLGRILMIF